MKQNTVSDKQYNAAKKSLLAMTKSLSQVIKLFGGLYAKKLEGTDGMTVEEYLEALGVFRPVTGEGENAKKGALTPASIVNAWHKDMKAECTDEKGKAQTVCYVFRNVPAVYVRKDSKGKEIKFRVYASKEAALDPEASGLSRYTLSPVGANNWSVETILKGLDQARKFKKHDEKVLEGEIAWEEVEECWIAYYVETEVDGVKTKTLQAEQVAKAQVEFRIR